MLDRPRLPDALHAELTRLRFGRWLGAALLDWAIIVVILTIVAAVDHPLAYAAAIFPLGSRQQALGALFHDAAHRLASRTRPLNDAAGGLLAAWPLGLTLCGYRNYHFAHHRKLGTDADPENGHKRAIRHWALPAEPGSVLAQFASDLVGGGVPHLLAAGRMTRPVRWKETALLLAWWLLAFALAYRTHTLPLLFLWVTSIATVFWSGVRLRIWTEHLGTRGTHRLAVGRWMSALVMPHNIGLHWEHHHFPRVPFYNLSRVRAALPTPPLVPMGALVTAFRASARLPSGSVGDTVHPEAPRV